MRKQSLPDTTSPSFVQDQLSDSGRASPTRPHTSHDQSGSFAHQQESFPQERLVAGTPIGSWPESLPDADGMQLSNNNVVPEVSMESDESHAEEHVPTPLGLPRMSFLEGDTSFNDLLKLGIKQPNLSPELTKSVDGTSVSTPNSDTPKPRTPTADAPQRREENKEAGPSKPSSIPPSIPIPPLKASPMGKSQKLPSPLTQLPRRNESLSRKMSSRKPVPKAIVLPDTFEEDMAIDLDEFSNGASSPGHTPRRSDAPSKTSDSVAKPPRRPGSAGVEYSRPPPLSPRSSARRASATMSSPLSTEPPTTPMRSTSNPSVTVTDSGSTRTARPTAVAKQDTSELVAKRIKEALTDGLASGSTSVRLDREFLEVIYMVVQADREKLHDMRGKFDGMRVSRFLQQWPGGP